MPDDLNEGARSQGFLSYTRAWRLRRVEGIDSLELLHEEFEASGCESDEDARALWDEAWIAATPPRRLPQFVAKRALNDAAFGARKIHAIINDPELPYWLLPPEGIAMLSVGIVSGEVKKRTLPFRPDVADPELLEHCRSLALRKDGSRKMRVWLQLGEDLENTLVMAGTTRVGWTSVEPDQVHKLRKRAWTRRVKVPDGSLTLTFSDQPEPTYGKLRIRLRKHDRQAD